jgi:hypothetical protein
VLDDASSNRWHVALRHSPGESAGARYHTQETTLNITIRRVDTTQDTRFALQLDNGKTGQIIDLSEADFTQLCVVVDKARYMPIASRGQGGFFPRSAAAQCSQVGDSLERQQRNASLETSEREVQPQGYSGGFY